VSLRRRLTLLSALAVAAAVALASVVVYALVRNQLRDQIDDTLRERAGAAQVLAGGAPLEAGPGGLVPQPPPPNGTPPPPSGAPPPEGLEPAPAAAGASIELPPPPGGEFVPSGQLVGADGEVRATGSGEERIPVSAATREVATGERKPFFENVAAGGTELRVFTVPAGPGAALQIARPFDEVNDTLGDLRLILVLVSLGGVALAAAFGLLVAEGALAPAAAISGAAEDVARTRDLTRRIEVMGSDELGRLAASFNAMMEALEASEEARRRLVADASHELRTPLATLRTNIETLGRTEDLGEGERRRVIEDLESELDDLSGLVGDVVELARDPEDPERHHQELRLDEVVEAAAERARRRGRGLRVETRLEPWLVRGDPQRLDRAIWNLLDNAIKWSPPGGGVEVELAGGRLSVRDHGQGFAAPDLPRAFDRFYRSDEARGRPGSGLGLAIARRIAEQHGGSAHAANAEDGGAVVTLELPGEGLPGIEQGTAA
jgi:two-component system sensor histidine kinase MprB